MLLAFKEMMRAKARFGLLVAALGLLVVLILFQQSLQNGLLTSFVGAIRNQSAPVLVYSVDGQRVIQGSVMTSELERLVEETARRLREADWLHTPASPRRAIRRDDGAGAGRRSVG